MNHVFIFFICWFCVFFPPSFPRLKKMIYAAPGIRGPHSPLAGKHCCNEHNSSNSEGRRRCLLSFQMPWEQVSGQLLPRRRVACCNSLLSFTIEITVFILVFQAPGAHSGKRQWDLRRRQTNREGKGRARAVGPSKDP